MCLIVFAWQVVPGAPLVAAANRDEYYERPASPAGWWEDQPEIYAGRDLQAGGTWIGITRSGRFAALTNIRNPADKRSDAPSRGALTTDFLRGVTTAEHYVAQLREKADRYNGFNLLVGDRDQLVWYSNRGDDDLRNGRALAPGLYGLSNAQLDTPWPKVVRTKAQFASLLCQGATQDAYFDMLADTTIASDCRLPKTGVDIETERWLSPVLIRSASYGTRVSTIVTLRQDGSSALLERPVATTQDEPGHQCDMPLRKGNRIATCGMPASSNTSPSSTNPNRR
ncbi:NRDE family protein [Lacisediminimonas sp.]|uniref:NRDE family protein n=1 Tax=Lacisediminimonas sp. TaxID=3060582 RepID=UPI00271DCE18|nr:NRDE family protein [Lacisediminimonas sp.]MDO8299963.1 NRDE family protein [Lacisediminimonas sp.]MDO9219253.1 NRDE family protein [Lacisediminimonas sp.]